MTKQKKYYTAKFLLVNGDIFEYSTYAESTSKAQIEAQSYMSVKNNQLPVTSPKRIQRLIGVV